MEPQSQPATGPVPPQPSSDAQPPQQPQTQTTRNYPNVDYAPYGYHDPNAAAIEQTEQNFQNMELQQQSQPQFYDIQKQNQYDQSNYQNRQYQQRGHAQNHQHKVRGGGYYNPSQNYATGYMGDDARRRDEERDRERARNGIRGTRVGAHMGMGILGGLGSGYSAMSLEVQRLKDMVNPTTFDTTAKNARFFIIKSYSEDDVHRSIKYGVWASTDAGNRRLDAAFRETGNRAPIYLFFSVNASGQFAGMAQMESAIDYTKKFGDWAQSGKMSGTFAIRWIFIKDLPNNQFRHITLINNDNKPVTNSRDTQEVLGEGEGGTGHLMLRIFHSYKARTSILDDYSFYAKRQELLEARSQIPDVYPPAGVPAPDFQAANAQPIVPGQVGAVNPQFSMLNMNAHGQHIGLGVGSLDMPPFGGVGLESTSYVQSESPLPEMALGQVPVAGNTLSDRWDSTAPVQ